MKCSQAQPRCDDKKYNEVCSLLFFGRRLSEQQGEIIEKIYVFSSINYIISNI
jgi:hypothetical protein